MEKQLYDSVTVYYFSGTGNAENTAIWIADVAEKSGFNVEIFNISEISRHEVPVPSEKSLIGFISPTHGFHFPKITRNFIKSFPESSNCSAFVVNTRAGTRIGNITIVGLSGLLHYWSSIVLKRKGLNIVGLFPVDLPSNWISVHPAFRKTGTEIIYKRVEPKVREFANKIINGGRSYRALYDIVQDVIIAPISVLYILFGKYFFAKSFIASTSCDNCDLCLNKCPVQAIKEVDGRKYWTAKCESCMQCMNICPNSAIETAHGFILLTWIITSVFLWSTINMLLKIPAFENLQWLHDDNVQLLIKSFLIFPFIFTGYRVMHWLMRFYLFERFFVLTSLTQYRFWGRYKASRSRDKK